MELHWDDSKLMAKVEAQTNRALDRSAQFIADYAKHSMRWPKSGKMPPMRTTKAGKIVRAKGVRGGKYKGWLRQRSAQGEPPAIQKGWLVKRITWDIPRAMVRRIGVMRDVPYARALELGTSRMAARPYLRISLYTCLDKVREFLGVRL
jgi:hypothetical protein